MFVATLSVNAQIDTLYLFGQTYHGSMECQIVTKYYSKQTPREVRAVSDFTNYPFVGHFGCSKCMTHIEKDSITNVCKERKSETKMETKILKNEMMRCELYNSGYYLQKSANSQYAAMGFAAVSGFIASIPAWKTDMGDGGRKACFAVGGVLGVAALVSEICAIDYKFRAGTSLKISATHIQYNF